MIAAPLAVTIAVLSAPAYLAGCVGVILALAAVVTGAVSVRRALVPSWTGAKARLADAILSVGAVIAVAQILGSFRAFSRGPMFIGCVLAGAAMAIAGWRFAPPAPERAPAPEREPAVERALAAVVIGIVGAQWLAHTIYALSTGMTQSDTLWYHAPYAARFVQSHAFLGLGHLGYPSSRWFPLNAELVHAIAILPFHRDVLNPLVNLGWMALTVLSAWRIGARRGVGALSIIGAGIVLGLPVIAGIEPGQASNDIPSAALMLASVALLLDGELAPGPTALAGLAAALALGTKLTVGGIVAMLSIGLLVIAVRRRSVALALSWFVPLLLSGYWFVRNWIGLGNPLPWFSLHLGPIAFSRSFNESGTSLASVARTRSIWRHVYIPGLAQGYGVLWPLVVVLVVVAIVFGLVRRRPSVERVVALSLIGGAVTYVFTPLTGGPGFVFNLRYIVAVLLIAFTTLPYVIADSRYRRRAGAWGASAGAALVLLDVIVTPGTLLPAWPPADVRTGIAAAVALGLFVLLVVVLLRRRLVGPVLIAVITLVAIIAVGFPVERRFERRRYLAAGLQQDHADRYFRTVRGARIADFGTLTYPMFGIDFSNVADQVTIAGAGSDTDRCRATLTMLGDHYQYVVLIPGAGFLPNQRPPDRWFVGATTPVERDGPVAVLRVDRPLDPATCAT